MNTLRLICGLLAASTSLAASGLDQHLVARWSFNNAMFADDNLKSDVGPHALRVVRHGQDAEISFGDGAVTLGRGLLLVCESISSKDTPELSSSVTLWARMRVEQAATGDCFGFGLRSKTAPGDWSDMVLTTLHRPEPRHATGFFARHLDMPNELTSGSRHHLIEPGRWVTVALVFDGTKREVSYVVDGKVLNGRHHDAITLATFTNFALGRLKSTGGNASLSFDEVRVYRLALTPEWIGEIQPTKEAR